MSRGERVEGGGGGREGGVGRSLPKPQCAVP